MVWMFLTSDIQLNSLFKVKSVVFLKAYFLQRLGEWIYMDIKPALSFLHCSSMTTLVQFNLAVLHQGYIWSSRSRVRANFRVQSASPGGTGLSHHSHLCRHNVLAFDFLYDSKGVILLNQARSASIVECLNPALTSFGFLPAFRTMKQDQIDIAVEAISWIAFFTSSLGHSDGSKCTLAHLHVLLSSAVLAVKAPSIEQNSGFLNPNNTLKHRIPQLPQLWFWLFFPEG